MENTKTIRFLDSKYRDYFTIEDGEEIVITYPSGETVTRQCFYEGECHFRTKGGDTYHIDQFTEIMKRNGNTYAPANKPLPEIKAVTRECKVTVEDGGGFRFFKWVVTGIDAERCMGDIRHNQRTERTEFSDKIFKRWYDCEATVVEVDLHDNEIPETERQPLGAELPDGAVVLDGEIPFKLDELYDMVAREYGYGEAAIDNMRYEPSKILVSKHILDQQYVAAEDAGIDSIGYAMYQANSGPKQDKTLKGNAVVVQDGFFIKAG